VLEAGTELEAELVECDEELAGAIVEDELDIMLDELMEVVELDELPLDNTK